MDGKRVWIACGLASLIFVTGCESMSNTAKGGLIGGGTGAGIGALAGGGKGAIIGGLAGTLVGGAIGNDVDRQEKRDMQHRLAVAESRPNSPPLGMSDVIQFTREGMPEEVIIGQIRSTRSTFQLSNEDLRTLQANNVSPRVIVEMQNRPPVQRVIHQPAPVIYTRPAPLYYDPYYYPPPPPSVGVGVRIR